MLSPENSNTSLQLSTHSELARRTWGFAYFHKAGTDILEHHYIISFQIHRTKTKCAYVIEYDQ